MTMIRLVNQVPLWHNVEEVWGSFSFFSKLVWSSLERSKEIKEFKIYIHWSALDSLLIYCLVKIKEFKINKGRYIWFLVFLTEKEGKGELGHVGFGGSVLDSLLIYYLVIIEV